MDSITARMKKWREENKEHVEAYAKEYRERHKREIAEKNKRWRQAHRDMIKKYGRQYFLDHQEELKLARRKDPEEIRVKKEKRHAAAVRRKNVMAVIYRKENKEKISEFHRTRRAKAKQEVFDGYGNKCTCCGEQTYEFLAIDHVNGGGNQMRKNKVHPDGYQFLKWLITNKFPKEFQLLCHNCNMAKGFLGYCPHEKVRSVV